MVICHHFTEMICQIISNRIVTGIFIVLYHSKKKKTLGMKKWVKDMTDEIWKEPIIFMNKLFKLRNFTVGNLEKQSKDHK